MKEMRRFVLIVGLMLVGASAAALLRLFEHELADQAEYVV